MSSHLPQFVKDMIGSPPPHGQGVHQWLFKIARHLYAHRDQDSIVSLLQAACDGCGRHVPQREVIAAVQDAKKCAWAPSGHAAAAKPKWPAVDAKRRAIAIEAAEMDVATLWDRSPVTMGEMDCEWSLDELFPGDPLLCIGFDNRRFATINREHWRGHAAEHALIVPSPMSAPMGTTQEGKASAHTLSNTGPRRYLVTEFDQGTQDDQAALLWHLQAFGPLVMVLFSGGKSLHGWWDCQGVDEVVTGQFFRYAVSLGADPATWLRSQFVRLPGGYRSDKDLKQEVYYFNRELIGKGQSK